MTTDMTAANTTREEILREIFRKMAPHDYQTIREAFYKAVEGLRTLADVLETADLHIGPTNEALIEEHLIACAALTKMKKSVLGRIL